MPISQRIQAQAISFVPDAASNADDSNHIFAGSKLQIHAEKTHIVRGQLDCAQGLKFTSITDYAGNNIITQTTTDAQTLTYDANATINFNNCTVENLVGSSVGQLEANQINSSNTGYSTVDNELDDIQTRVTLNTQRTTGLTANKLVSTSGAGIIQASSIDPASVPNKTSGAPQTFAGILASDSTLFAGTADPVGDGLHQNVAISGTTSAIILKNYNTSSGVDTPYPCVVSFNDDVHGLRLGDNSNGDLELDADAGKGSLNLATSGAQYQIGGAQITTQDLGDGSHVVIDDFTGTQTLDCVVLQLNGANGVRFGSSPQYHIKSDYSNNRLLYSSNFDHVFQAGTNGATTACQIADDGVNIVDLSDANIGYTAPAGLTRVATRAYVGALLQSSTTQTAIINTIEFTNTVFREFDATPTALTLTINRPTTITKDLTLTGKISGDLVFNSSSTIDFTDNANLSASQFCALDANKHITTRAIADADGVVLKTGTQLITGTKSFNAGCNALSGWNIFGGNLNIDNTDQITTHTTFGNSYVAGTDQEYCASRGCVFLTGAQTISGDKTHTGASTHDDLRVSSSGTLKLLDNVNIADGSILGVNAGRFVVSRSLGDADGVVMKTGAQTIAGAKTFTDSVTVGDVNTAFSFFSTAGVLSLKSTAPAVQFNYTAQNIQIVNDATNQLSIENANVKIDTARDIQRTKNSIAVTDYLDIIDEMRTDYRRKIVSTELFGADWVTPTLYKEFNHTSGSTPTEYTGTGSAPRYAEITVLKWARSLSSSDASHPSKYTKFIHNTNTNTAWSLDYSTAAEGAKKSGVFIVSLNFNGNNRGASTTRFSDFAFIGNTWISGASCRVDIHNNIHGVNDNAPDYTPLSTSCTYHANASADLDEFDQEEQPVFLMKNVAASPFELVLRFPITNTPFGESYGYTNTTGGTNTAQDAEFLRKKNVNVDVKVRQLDTWEHYPTDFTAYDYTS